MPPVTPPDMPLTPPRPDALPLAGTPGSRAAARLAAHSLLRARRRQHARLPRIAIIGNHPPRRCGIATFTRDVAVGLAGCGCELHVTAMHDGPVAHAYPGEVATVVDATSRDAHRRAGGTIDRWRPDAVLVEHEFGIFGGPSGLWLLDMLEAIDAPVVVTLHTVLAEPNAEQAYVLARLAARASRLIVMARAGAAILRAQGVPAGRIAVVPHGAPDRPWRRPAEARARIGWPEAPTLLTFGLLSPGKGIEHAIDALPRILRDVPNARYVLLGATHPHLLAREGESYREGLRARAGRLGVDHALTMIPRFVSNDELCDALAASDLYVTPYGNPQQITSGTLSYALALGKPVISTPYVHAREVLPAEWIVPHGDAGALGEGAASMLSDPAALDGLSRETWERFRPTVWPAVARRTLDVLRAVARSAPALEAAE